MPRFLVNDRCLLSPATGVATYLRNVLAFWPADSALRPAGFWTDLDALRPPPAPIAEPRPLRLEPLRELQPPSGLSGRAPWWARRIVQKARAASFARRFRRGGYAAYFEPNHLAFPCGGPTVTTIHDLSVLEHPAWHPTDRVRQWEASLAASLAATTRWVAVSNFTARRMEAVMAVPTGRITVIPSAARPLRYPTSRELAAGRRTLNLPDRYLLHLGTIEPRKNLQALLEAWGRLPAEARQRCPLVLAGGVGWGRTEFWRGLKDHPMADEIRCTGYASDEQAAWLLAGAAALLAPSRYEGFGLPILEAMACGTPVICSRAEALVETAGNAAAFVDADDVPGWSEAMLRAVKDARRREALGQAGLRRAAEFSWAKSAAAHEALLAGV